VESIPLSPVQTPPKKNKTPKTKKNNPRTKPHSNKPRGKKTYLIYLSYVRELGTKYSAVEDRDRPANFSGKQRIFFSRSAFGQKAGKTKKGALSPVWDQATNSTVKEASGQRNVDLPFDQKRGKNCGIWEPNSRGKRKCPTSFQTQRGTS